MGMVLTTNTISGLTLLERPMYIVLLGRLYIVMTVDHLSTSVLILEVNRRSYLVMILTRNYYVVNGLRLLWTFTILWYELGIFFRSTRDCRWPDAVLSERHDQGHPTITPRQDDTASHILLIADPQILDHRSYDRSALLTYLTRLIVDLNLRKNWRAALRKKPDIVVFLGDMMDGGRFKMPDAECVLNYDA